MNTSLALFNEGGAPAGAQAVWVCRCTTRDGGTDLEREWRLLAPGIDCLG